MQYTYEFEIWGDDDDFYFAQCQALDVMTQGRDEIEIIEMAEDVLRMTIEDCLLNDKEIPPVRYCDEPQNGGEMWLISVEVDLEEIKAIPANEAARHLGITPSRVSQLLNAGRLEGYKRDGVMWVTLDSVNGRMSEKPKAGRPAKE